MENGEMSLDERAIIEKVGNIAEMIRDSELYRRYTVAKAVIRSDYDLHVRINEFKRLDGDFKKNVENNWYDYEEEKRVSTIYWDLMLNKDAADFFECESRLVDLRNEINTIISTACPHR